MKNLSYSGKDSKSGILVLHKHWKIQVYQSTLYTLQQALFLFRVRGFFTAKGCLLLLRLLICIPGLYPLDVNNTPWLWQLKMSQTLANASWGNVLLADKCICSKRFPWTVFRNIDFKQIIEREFFLPKFTYLSFKIIFYLDHFKVFIDFVTALSLFYVLFFCHGDVGS